MVRTHIHWIFILFFKKGPFNNRFFTQKRTKRSRSEHMITATQSRKPSRCCSSRLTEYKYLCGHLDDDKKKRSLILNAHLRLESEIQKCWRSTRSEHFIDLLQPPSWLVSLEMLWEKPCLRREDFIELLLLMTLWHLGQFLFCDMCKLTHDVKSLLRNPADIHVAHPTGALFNFHWQPLFLQGEQKQHVTFQLV